MIADSQALTDNFDNPSKIRDNLLQVALDDLAAGLDPEKMTLFIQSEVPELTEMTFYFMNLVTLSRLERNPTVKNEIQLRGFNNSIPVGFPITGQSASILQRSRQPVSVGRNQSRCKTTRDRAPFQ